jgi:1,4-dihydroxy-2-naphthoyl-CoA hydrolase
LKGQKIPWRPEATLAAMNAKAHDTMVETLGIVLTDVGDDYLKGTMPVTARNCQPMRILHGGASVAFAESLASIASNWSLNDEQAAVGQEINANHLRPAREGETVTGITRLVYAGARSQVWTIDISNEQGQPVCISRITIAIIKRRP